MVGISVCSCLLIIFLIGVAISSTNSPAYSQEEGLEVNTYSQGTPRVKDTEGNILSSISVGQIIILSVANVNSGYDTQPCVAIMEVRNSRDVTVFLEFQFGTLEPLGRIETGISWTPSERGTYQLRTFLLSDLTEPEILSAIKTSEIEVGVS